MLLIVLKLAKYKKSLKAYPLMFLQLLWNYKLNLTTDPKFESVAVEVCKTTIPEVSAPPFPFPVPTEYEQASHHAVGRRVKVSSLQTPPGSNEPLSCVRAASEAWAVCLDVHIGTEITMLICIPVGKLGVSSSHSKAV